MLHWKNLWMFTSVLLLMTGCLDIGQSAIEKGKQSRNRSTETTGDTGPFNTNMFIRGGFLSDTERDSMIRYNYQIIDADKNDLMRYTASIENCNLYYDLDNDSAIYYGRKSYMYAVKLQNDRLLARALTSIAVATNLSGRSSEALDSLFKARDILASFSKQKDSAGWIITYRQIGGVYLYTGDHQSAIPYYLAALHIKPRGSMDSLFHAFALIDMASLYLEQSDESPEYLDSAIHYVALVKKFEDELCKDNNCDNHILPEALNTLANVRFKKGDTTGAIRELHRGLSALGNSSRTRFSGDFNVSLAEIFLGTGNKDSGYYYASKAMHIAEKVNSPKLLESSSRLISAYFASRQNMDSAFYYLKVNQDARNVLHSTSKTNRIKQLSIDESLRQKEEAARLQAYRNRVQRLALLLIAAVFMVSGIVLWRNNRLKHQLNLQLEDQRNRLQQSLEELKSTQAQLIQSEKMASLGELTAGIAHEIQNPLNFVNNFSDLNQELIEELKEELNRGDVKEAATIVDNLKENEAKINLHGRRADGIVKSMLQHSRSSSGQKEPTDINKLVDEYTRLAYHGFRAKHKDFNVKLDINLDPNLPQVPLMAQDIGRVVLNLLNNAFQAVEEKARTAGTDYQPTVSIQTKSGITHSQDSLNPKSDIRNPKSIAIAIADNGPGIPDHARDKIFQPFFTTKPTGQGTGLGLSMSYDIVKAHGGSLRFESDASRGTTFIVEIPAGA